jgi:ubiquinone/menaquinone biosynthesis C-methylase UbiE
MKNAKKISDPESFWNERFDEFGKLSTGFTDELLYRYDDKLRRKAFSSKIDLKKKPKILDVGCNYGPWTLSLAKMGLDVTGIDISSQAIKEAKKIAFDNNVQIRYLAKKAEDIEFGDEKFDIILSVTVLQHILDDKLYSKSLRKFHKYLEEGGKLVLIESAPNRKKRDKLSYKKERTFRKQIDLCREAGFRLVDYSGIDFLTYSFYWGINILPLPKKLKKLMQRTSIPITYFMDTIIGKIRMFSPFSYLKIMVFRKIK